MSPPKKSPCARRAVKRWRDAALARYEERMARALASVINMLDPDVIVLGGGLSNIDRLYDSRAGAVAAAHVLGPRRHAACPSDARRLQRRPRRGVAMAGVGRVGRVRTT